MDSSLLIVDDNPDILTSLKILLKGTGLHIDTEQDPRKIPYLLNQKHYDLVLLDMNFSRGISEGEEGLRWLQEIKEREPDLPVILITAYGDIDIAVEGMKKGASDFVQKPWENDKLLSTVKMAIQLRTEQRKARLLQAGNSYLAGLESPLVGESREMERIREMIEKISPTDANVLITGENGTGKDLAAKTIHLKSSRAEGIYLAVDMGAIPESLFESEMFGYGKGAFTGAERKRIGRMEAATGGTLFLDEIANIPLGQQAKLLRALETKEILPLGEERKRAVDFRLICATNGNLDELVEKGRFRRDLLFRMNTVEVPIPSLRERAGDIPLLANHFLKEFAHKYGRELRISPSAMKQLEKYSWPGNVRELRHMVERAVILCDGTVLDFNDSLNDRKICHEKAGNYNLEEMERETIIRAMKAENSNLTRTAEQLGVTRSTLYRKMEKYGL